MRNLFSLFERQFIVRILILISLYEFLSAGMTLSLIRIGQSGLQIESIFQNMALFFACYLLNPVLNIFIKRAEQLGYFTAYFNFLSRRSIDQMGRPTVWKNTQQRESFLAAVGAESETYLTAIAFTVQDSYSYLLKAILNTIVFASFLDSSFVYVYLAAFSLSGLFFFAIHHRLGEVVKQEQNQRVEMHSLVLKMWDNLFLKNKPNQQIYQSALRDQYKKTQSRIYAATGFSEFSIMIMSWLSSLPVLIAVAVLLVQHQGDATYLAPLLISLPRQLDMVSTIRFFLQQLTNLKSFSVRLNTAWTNSELRPLDMHNLVKVEQVRVNGAAFASTSEALDFLLTQKSGRFTITGENGSGKSSLLLATHEVHRASIYMPAHPQLMIDQELGSESSGEKIIKLLDFYCKKTLDEAFFLDEWDANLDESNMKKISNHLDQLAQNRLVIEVRHRA